MQYVTAVLLTFILGCVVLVPKTAVRLAQKTDITKFVGDGTSTVQTTDLDSQFYIRYPGLDGGTLQTVLKKYFASIFNSYI